MNFFAYFFFLLFLSTRLLHKILVKFNLLLENSQKIIFTRYRHFLTIQSYVKTRDKLFTVNFYSIINTSRIFEQ